MNKSEKLLQKEVLPLPVRCDDSNLKTLENCFLMMADLTLV